MEVRDEQESFGGISTALDHIKSEKNNENGSSLLTVEIISQELSFNGAGGMLAYWFITKDTKFFKGSQIFKYIYTCQTFYPNFWFGKS